MNNRQTGFYMDGWYVDTATNRVSKVDRESGLGEPAIKLESRVMAVLVYLAQHAGEVLSREQIEQAVWGETVVGYDALTRCIALLRKELGDSTRSPRYIETVSKKGYRLIASITRESPQTLDTLSKGSNTSSESVDRIGKQADPKNQKPNRIFRRPGIQALAIVVLAVAAGLAWIYYPWSGQITPPANRASESEQPTIAVLPFRSMSDDTAQQYLTHGMTTDITTALSKLSGLLVISHSSSQVFAEPVNGKQMDRAAIANALKVRYLLEGSVRLHGEQIRVNVHLTDTIKGTYLWSEKYDYTLDKLFDVQDTITRSVVAALSVTLTEQEKQRQARKYTINIEAYNDFLNGQVHYMRYTREDNQIARTHFQNAFLRDATFARAYSAMALTYVTAHRRAWGSAEDLLDQGLKYAQQAALIDNDLPQAWWVLSYVYLFRQEWDKSVEAASRVIELNPNYADAYVSLAINKIHFELPDEALLLIRKAVLLNPEYPAAYASVLGQAYYYKKDYEQALPALYDAIDRNLNLLIPHVFLVACLSKLERLEEAQWALEQIKVISPDFSADHIEDMLPVRDSVKLAEIKRLLVQLGL